MVHVYHDDTALDFQFRTFLFHNRNFYLYYNNCTFLDQSFWPLNKSQSQKSTALLVLSWSPPPLKIYICIGFKLLDVHDSSLVSC